MERKKEGIESRDTGQESSHTVGRDKVFESYLIMGSNSVNWVEWHSYCGW